MLQTAYAVQGEKASLAKQGQDANGMKKEEPQSQSLMYPVSYTHLRHLHVSCENPVQRLCINLSCTQQYLHPCGVLSCKEMLCCRVFRTA